ncbi:MAG: glycosyltransferase family 2 protein, partial [Candidatus Omnitrophica bacterium]|nr:glycosyltransferase family 2 protein [Candidatus Omnitrophota bacterium]
MEDEKELKVSVIIPTYNFGCYIEDAIKSVLSQTYKNIEIVVVDGMSSDNTYEVLKPYLDRINYINKTKKGIIAARNAGIMSSTGHYICLLDADDIFEPNKIQEQVSFLEKYPELDFIISDFSEFDERGVIV